MPEEPAATQKAGAPDHHTDDRHKKPRGRAAGFEDSDRSAYRLPFFRFLSRLTASILWMLRATGEATKIDE